MVYAKKIILTAALALAAISTDLSAKITLPPFISDNMVLQHSATVELWGTAKAGAKVKVTPSWDGSAVRTRASEDGSWSVKLNTPGPGGPYSVSFSDGDGKPLKISNVLCGEVWLCGGQSNMEMPVGGSWGKVLGWKDELARAGEYGNIRLLRVERAVSPRPEESVAVADGAWTECSEWSLNEFSATAWFFGKYLSEQLGVPVGLVESCWGGTIIEAWTSAGTLGRMDRYKPTLDQMAELPQTREERAEAFNSKLAAWEKEMCAGDPKCASAFTPGSDTRGWTPGKAPGYLQNQGIEGMHGYFWMKKDVMIPESWAGHDLDLHLGYVDDNDFTYFNGECLGHTEGCIFLRNYKVPGRLVKAGLNSIAIRVMDTGGLSGITGEESLLSLGLPEGGSIPLAGEWLCSEISDIGDAPVFPVNMDVDPNLPSALYNSMIWPLRRLRIKGAIWYQGESNASDAARYKILMPAMIRDWRLLWGYDFPFYYAQIANYLEEQKGAERSEWAELREAQLQSLAVENTGMAVLIDIGEAGDIHPKNKPEVGRRLALNALALTYGRDVVYSGPLYDGYSIEGASLRIRFTHTDGGLKSADGGPLKGFWMAGLDGKFLPATAVIDGDTVVVSCPEVDNAVSVRYAWANNPPCNLVNGAGLPASPFRTDSWPR